MKRTTITLSEDVAREAGREARRRGVSLSELVREALVAHLGLRASTRRRIPFASLGASGHRTTARDMGEILGREWTANRRR